MLWAAIRRGVASKVLDDIQSLTRLLPPLRQIEGAHVAIQTKSKKKASNVERLESAGVLVAEQFTDSDKKTVEKLSEVEVTALINVPKKRGSAPAGKHHLRPNIFVEAGGFGGRFARVRKSPCTFVVDIHFLPLNRAMYFGCAGPINARIAISKSRLSLRPNRNQAELAGLALRSLVIRGARCPENQKSKLEACSRESSRSAQYGARRPGLCPGERSSQYRPPVRASRRRSHRPGSILEWIQRNVRKENPRRDGRASVGVADSALSRGAN